MMERKTDRILAVLLLAAFCACGTEPVPQEDKGTGVPVRFSFSMDSHSVPLTKDYLSGPPTTETYLKSDGNVVRVFGTWEHGSEVDNMFSDVALTCVDNGQGVSPRYSWEYSPPKYWRHGGKYHFRAVFPSRVHPEFGSNGQRFVTSYSMLSDDFDLLIANGERDNTSTDNTDIVPLNFKHACAAVRVIFSKGTHDEYRHYMLDSFEMQNLHAVGVLVGQGNEVSRADWNPAEYRYPSVWAWHAPEERLRIDVPKEYTDFITHDYSRNGWTHWHYAIPQDLNQADGLVPAIRYGVYVRQCEDDGEGGERLVYETEDPIYTVLPLPLTYPDGTPVIWEPGKIYTYRVVIQKGDDHITVWVDDWDRYDVHVDDVNFG